MRVCCEVSGDRVDGGNIDFLIGEILKSGG